MHRNSIFFCICLALLRFTASTGAIFEVLDPAAVRTAFEVLMAGTGHAAKTTISLAELVVLDPSPPPLGFCGVWPRGSRAWTLSGVLQSAWCDISDRDDSGIAGELKEL